MTESIKTVYLKDGRTADLITKTEKGYLVDPYIVWNDYEGQAESAPSGQVELVDKVFQSAPVELIESEYKKWVDRVAEQNISWEARQQEFQKLNSEVSRLRNEKTNLERYIINREELRTAKRLIIWPSNQIAPRIMDGAKSYKFNVCYEISQYAGKEKVWCYHGYDDSNSGWSSFSEHFDESVGLKIDLTDEQILAITIERIPRFKNGNYNWKHILLNTSDQWLTPEFIEEKKKLKEENRVTELQKAEKELKEAKERVEKLKAIDLVTN